jgi:O-antigen/teichoic acid export membrane protein
LLHISNATDGNEGYGHLRSGRARAAVRGVFWSAVSGFAPAAVAAGVFTVTSRFLTPGEFGLVALATSIAMLASAIAPAGFGQALIQRPEIGRSHVDSVFWLCLVVALAIYGGLLLAAAPLSAFFGEQGLAMLLPVLGARVIFDLAAVVPNALLTRSMAFNKLAWRASIASLVAGAVCLTLLFMGYGIWALALSQLASSIAVCVGSVLAANWLPGWRFDRGALRELARFAMFASGNRVIRLLNVEQILVGALLGAVSLGLFSFARRIFQILNDLIAGALNAVSYTLMASMQSEQEKLRQAFLFTTFASSAISFPVFVGVGAIAGDLVPVLFGAHWVAAVPAIQGFCLIGLLSCIGILQSSLINSQGNANWWFYYLAAKQVITALIVVVFHQLGVTVLVLAIAALSFLMWPISVAMVLRILKIDFWSYARPFLAPVLSSGAMLASVLAVQHFTATGSAYLDLLAQIGAGAVTYGAALLSLDSGRIFRMRDLILKRGTATA